MYLFNKAPVVQNQHSENIPCVSTLEKAATLLNDFQKGVDEAVLIFKEFHPAYQNSNFTPTLQDARVAIMRHSMSRKKLSLERLKREAKNLLKAIKSQDGETESRFRQGHRKVKSGLRTLDQITLADCHFLLARENGFESWAKLKNHLSDMAMISKLMSSSKTLDVADSVHIRCGDDIGPALKKAGLQGEFQQIINPFIMGPVTSPLMKGDALDHRAGFIETVLGPYIPKDRANNTKKDLAKEEAFLEALPDKYRSINLWFEHDAYDQLCLAYILHHMALKKNNLRCELNLVQIDGFPGIEKFIGLGQLSKNPDCIALLYQQRLEVTPAMIAFGSSIWQAFTSSTPLRLWELSQQQKAPLPLMQQAMLRMLAELPSTHNGLGLTQRIILNIVSQEGSLLMRRVFLFALAEHDPQPYHGDITFFAMVKVLIDAPKPALEIVETLDIGGDHGREVLKITDFGKALLDGKENWFAHNPSERWVGGVQVCPDKKHYWSFEGKEPKLAQI